MQNYSSKDIFIAYRFNCLKKYSDIRKKYNFFVNPSLDDSPTRCTMRLRTVHKKMHFLAKAGGSTCKVMNLLVVSGYYGGRFTIFTEILKHGITGY